MHILGIFAIIYTLFQLLKEALQKPLPAGSWDNWKLYQQDVSNGVSQKQIMKYAAQGRYRRSKGYYAFKDDLAELGYQKVSELVEQDSYLLTEEEMEIVRNELFKEYVKECQNNLGKR